MKFTFSFISFILWLSLSLQAQDPNNLAVDGTVKDEDGGRITGASIALYQDGVELKRVTTGNNGRFDLYLDFGHEYIIEISKSSYVTKKLYLNTNNVPVDEQLWGYEFGGFVVDMFKRMDGVDYSILDKPIGKVYYEPNVENFVDDKLYTREIKAEVDRLEQAQKDKIKAEKEQEKRLEEDYQLAIKDAQAAIDDGDYLLAKDNLLAAQSMQPDSKIASQMLSQVEAKLNTEGAAQEKYLSVLASADQAFGNQNYEAAIAAYQEALALKPSEDYPKNRLKESQELFAKQKLEREAAAALAAKDKQYNDEIAKADAAYAKNEFTNARALYQNALKYKDDAYPKSKLKEIEIRLADLALEQEKKQKQAQIDAAYADKIDKANTAFNAQNYQLAEQHYQAALGIKPDEVYPKTQLEVIQTKLSELAEADKLQAEKLKLDNDYKAAIARADKAYAAKSYEVAKTEYQAALSIKPKEIYPSDLVKKIDAELSRLAALESENAKKEAELKKQKEYEGLIAVANEDFGKKDWNTAIANYKLTLGLKPNESYPITQISLAEAEIAKVSKQAELDDAYNKRIASGDAAFNRGEYANAIAEYNGALSVKANEKYPKNKIAEIEGILNSIAAAQSAAEAEAKEKEAYENLLKRAQGELDAGDYRAARASYTEAQSQNPSDPFPTSQIKKIDQLIVEKEAKEKEETAKANLLAEYNNYMRSGNEAMVSKEYVVARTSYTAALAIFPDEALPKSKLSMIDDLEQKAEQARIKEEYNAAIAIADKFFLDKNYEEAKTKYQDALTILPRQSHAQERLQKCDEMIAELSKVAATEEEDNKRRVIEETFDEGRTKVTVRRVIVNGREEVYKRVVHSWGGKYYFLDEQPITELVWNRETVK